MLQVCPLILFCAICGLCVAYTRPQARQKKQAQEEMRARMQRMAAAANQYAPK